MPVRPASPTLPFHVTSPADFFAEENIGRIMAGAGT
jgi:hypothetical protein